MAERLDVRLRVAVLMALATALVLSRAPWVLWHARFWAEDGAKFYADAYNARSLLTLLWPYSGYLQLLPRAAALLALGVPLLYAPLVMNLVGLAIQLLPVLCLLAGRLDRTIPDQRMRLALAFLYIAVPNSNEVNVNVTNAQWHLALVGAAVLLAEGAPSRTWRAFDLSALGICALTGPFIVFLAPLAVWRLWRHRDLSAWYAAVAAVGAVVQGAVFLSTDGSRMPSSLGGSWSWLARDIGGQAFLGGAIGMTHYGSVTAAAWWGALWLPLAVTIIGVALLAPAALHGPRALRWLLMFTGMLLGAALVRGAGTWTAMAHVGNGTRYFVLPIIAWLMALVWTATWPGWRRLPQAAALTILALSLLVAVPSDWAYPAWPAVGWGSAAIAHSRHGTHDDRLPINPPGWSMLLMRR